MNKHPWPHGAALALILLLAGGRLDAQATAGRILLESAMGGALAFGGAVGLGVLGAVTIGAEGGEDPGLVGAAIGALVGTSIGAGAGAAAGARIAGRPIPFARCALGAVAGTATFLLLRPSLGLDPDYGTFWIAWFAAPVAGAVIAAETGLPTNAFLFAPVTGPDGRWLAGMNLPF